MSVVQVCAPALLYTSYTLRASMSTAAKSCHCAGGGLHGAAVWLVGGGPTSMKRQCGQMPWVAFPCESSDSYLNMLPAHVLLPEKLPIFLG